ncbi:MAG: hypothetical protein FWG42_01705 [Clostridiales bacterium]|nr:hypothetical protein [Clostridiales bacterium]
MKKVMLVIIVISLIAAIGFSDDPREVAVGSRVNQSFQSEYKNLSKTMEAAGSLSDVKKYLSEWAGSHKYALYSDAYDNVVISKSASAGFEKEKSTILHCALSLDQVEKRTKSIATALFVLANAENHGALELLLTADKAGDMQGVQKINGQYLMADRLINLDNQKENTITTASAGISDYYLTRKIRWVAPTCKTAYEITIDGLDVSNSGFLEGENPAPNAIKALVGIVSGAKGAGVKLELAALNGGNSITAPPSVATMTVLVSDGDSSRFTERVSAAREKYLDTSAEANPGLTYEFTEVPLPAKVISEEDFASITSLLVMAPDGARQAGVDGALVSVSTLGTVSTHTGIFSAGINARSLTADTAEDLAETIKSICWLSGMACTENEISPVTSNDDGLARELSALLEEGLGDASAIEKSLQESEWAVLKNRNPGLSAASMCTSGDKPLNAAKALLRFLNSMSF